MRYDYILIESSAYKTRKTLKSFDKDIQVFSVLELLCRGGISIGFPPETTPEDLSNDACVVALPEGVDFDDLPIDPSQRSRAKIVEVGDEENFGDKEDVDLQNQDHLQDLSDDEKAMFQFLEGDITEDKKELDLSTLHYTALKVEDFDLSQKDKPTIVHSGQGVIADMMPEGCTGATICYLPPKASETQGFGSQGIVNDVDNVPHESIVTFTVTSVDIDISDDGEATLDLEEPGGFFYVSSQAGYFIVESFRPGTIIMVAGEGEETKVQAWSVLGQTATPIPGDDHDPEMSNMLDILAISLANQACEYYPDVFRPDRTFPTFSERAAKLSQQEPNEGAWVASMAIWFQMLALQTDFYATGRLLHADDYPLVYSPLDVHGDMISQAICKEIDEALYGDEEDDWDMLSEIAQDYEFDDLSEIDPSDFIEDYDGPILKRGQDEEGEEEE